MVLCAVGRSVALYVQRMKRQSAPELPPIAFKVEFGAHKIPTEMIAGQQASADVTFKNVSERSWPSKPNQKAPRLTYKLQCFVPRYRKTASHRFLRKKSQSSRLVMGLVTGGKSIAGSELGARQLYDLFKRFCDRSGDD